MRAELSREGIVNSVEVAYMADESGLEYTFRPVRELSLLQERFPPPSPGILSEIRLLARSGAARFIVEVLPDDLGRVIVPHLPALLLDQAWRAVHLGVNEHESHKEAFSVLVSADRDEFDREVESLRQFHFDAVTVDPTGASSTWSLAALEVAAVVFILWSEREDDRLPYEAGIRWRMKVEQHEGERLEWSLDPLQV